jgi:hypothetical protein
MFLHSRVQAKEKILSNPHFQPVFDRLAQRLPGQIACRMIPY